MSPDPTATDKSPSSEALLDAAIRNGSTSQLDEALWQATNSPDTFEDFASSALRQAAQSGSVTLTSHLLESEGVPVTALGPEHIASKPSIPLFETLLANGWDLNQASPKDNFHKGKRIIDRVLPSDDLVVWLVEHGAKVDGGEEEYESEPRPPLLLESCAALGSVKTFKFLQSKGAKIGKRSLHAAVAEAAAIGADPSRSSQEDGNRHKSNIEEVLRYLVDDQKLDVNALDSNIEKPRQEGPPLAYAVTQTNGAAVVRWLLEKGADPSIKRVGGVDVKEKAEAYGISDILTALNR
ncbi:hypothetical protein CC80DRAFT_495572 [Byssothecium circinans]|uniref:Ankyrin n=1 Tax=Byssothecium circinans TaxID=147558 RepID=A0A6A5TI22_9PLEO|nr:hypothetical protein CC80DRAFT_495572 [Byssothecium circinans]